MTRWILRIPFMLALGVIITAASPRANAPHTPATRVISGRVLQVESVTPIATVQVMVRGERIGVFTNVYGRFTLPDVPTGTVELVLRHPCYFPVHVALPATGDAVVAIGLPFDESSLRRAGCGGLGARSPDTVHTN